MRTERVHVRLLAGVTSRRARGIWLWWEGFDHFNFYIVNAFMY